ncbi:MAG: recombination protein RecR [Gemmatimonadetes bacterium]|nr:recombination protein RecR [Gemmatimonadota bacterium]
MSVIEDLTGELTRLPGIGPKTAQRLVYHLMKGAPEDALRLAHALEQLVQRIRRCERCGNYAEEPLCAVCSNPRRDPGLICVVEEAADVDAVERGGGYRGLYHVLGGRLSPLDGVGPEQLDIERLVERIQSSGEALREVIVATSANVEGEATAVYLEKRVRGLGPRVTRLARGIPVGSDLEYVDASTIAEALAGRRDM